MGLDVGGGDSGVVLEEVAEGGWDRGEGGLEPGDGGGFAVEGCVAGEGVVGVGL